MRRIPSTIASSSGSSTGPGRLATTGGVALYGRINSELVLIGLKLGGRFSPVFHGPWVDAHIGRRTGDTELGG
jgi:hypothetical protein